MEFDEHADAIFRALQNPGFRVKMGIVSPPHLGVTSAAHMMHLAHLSHQQYRTVAATINSELPVAYKYTYGGCLPGINQLTAAMDTYELRLHYSHQLTCWYVDAGTSEICAVDEGDESDSDVEILDDSIESCKTRYKVVCVKKPMDTLVKRELTEIRKRNPQCWEAIMNPEVSEQKPSGIGPVIDIVLMMDGTQFQSFTNGSKPYELGALKMILPGVSCAQQAHFNCMPLFLMAGPEKYSAIQAILARLFSADGGALADNVWVDGENDEPAVRVTVHWALCSDLKLLLLVMGFKAGGTYPCFMCKQERSNLMQGPGAVRTVDDPVHEVASAFQEVLDLDSQVCLHPAFQI